MSQREQQQRFVQVCAVSGVVLVLYCKATTVVRLLRWARCLFILLKGNDVVGRHGQDLTLSFLADCDMKVSTIQVGGKRVNDAISQSMKYDSFFSCVIIVAWRQKVNRLTSWDWCVWNSKRASRTNRYRCCGGCDAHLHSFVCVTTCSQAISAVEKHQRYSLLVPPCVITSYDNHNER